MRIVLPFPSFLIVAIISIPRRTTYGQHVDCRVHRDESNNETQYKCAEVMGGEDGATSLPKNDTNIAPELVFVGTGVRNLQICQGHCYSDIDCAYGLTCHVRDPSIPVHGCSGTHDDSTYMNYCFPPTIGELVLVERNNNSDIPLKHCQGHCWNDSDCDGSLVCFVRVNNEAVPGCKGAGAMQHNYCYDPLSSNVDDAPTGDTPMEEDETKQYDLEYIGEPPFDSKLGACQGDCDSDWDCAFGLNCYKRADSRLVPSCRGDGIFSVDYCFFPNPGELVITMDARVSGDGATQAGRCEGHCINDSDCQEGLKCMQRTNYEDVPGCDGVGAYATNYCYDPSDPNGPSLISPDAPSPSPTNQGTLGNAGTAVPTSKSITSDLSSQPTKSPTAGFPVSIPIASGPPSEQESESNTVAPTLFYWNANKGVPSQYPSNPPSNVPLTRKPSSSPTNTESSTPSQSPTSVPSKVFSSAPSMHPSAAPSVSPTFAPTVSPSAETSSAPTTNPSDVPSMTPTFSPTVAPSAKKSSSPSTSPSDAPSLTPSLTPTSEPLVVESTAPSMVPSDAPSVSPTSVPSVAESLLPSMVPSDAPSITPSTSPTSVPSKTTSSAPSMLPSDFPSIAPSTSPTFVPSIAPSSAPSVLPSDVPSIAPSSSPTSAPSISPSSAPSILPSDVPSLAPSLSPSSAPSIAPSLEPSISPSNAPSSLPSLVPSVSPSNSPSSITSSSVSSPPSRTACGMMPSQRDSEITSLLFNVTMPSMFLDGNGNAQARAYQWLVNEDEFYVCPYDPNVAQRYILAVLYFATNGEAWLHCSNNTASSCDEDRFLSASHECEWGGVGCNSDNHVISFHMSENNMSGTLPTELAHLSLLTEISMDTNALQGTLPSTWNQLTLLEILDLDNNQFTGIFPDSFYNAMTSLRVIDLDHNQLRGSISSRIGQLKDLYYMQLDFNNLTGSIPSELGTLGGLQYLSVFGNNFTTDALPSVLCGSNLTLYANCDLCSISDTCCTACLEV